MYEGRGHVGNLHIPLNFAANFNYYKELTCYYNIHT